MKEGLKERRVERIQQILRRIMNVLKMKKKVEQSLDGYTSEEREIILQRLRDLGHED